MKILKLSKSVQAQEYGGYYSGNTPDYNGSYIGSPNVDLSQLSSQFGDAQKSVDLVNEFDQGLLKNIVYMFNFAKSGVYGVYVPSLDKAVKTQELSNRLKSMGYEIVEEDGMLRAYPKEGEKSQEEISAEIKKVYDDLEMKGGSVLGININDTRNEVEGSFNNLKDAVPEESHPMLRNDLMVAHIAATMAHEATHAHGHEGEGLPQQVETKLLNYALDKILQKYQVEGEATIQKGASSKNWYKEAQAYFPIGKPIGSDLSGRHGGWSGELGGMGDWGLMAHQYSNRAIEEMLGRQFQSALPPDLSQEHDSYELQLRKYTRDDYQLDPNLIFDELLKEHRVEDGSEYKSLEELLEDRRPQPLMMPIKSASKLKKEATLFGWFNNLDISDGSTIPGMGDRAMAWDDRDESFSEEENWIKEQPRYNPTYDVKGFYYRWVEPHFQPESWESYTRDYSNTHPAKRFASKNDLGCLIDSLQKVRRELLDGKMQATRFICSVDVLDVIDKILSNEGIGLQISHLGECNGEEVYSCWVYCSKISGSTIEEMEEKIRTDKDNAGEYLAQVLGVKSTLSDSVSKIMSAVEEVCTDYETVGIYAIGSYARLIAMGEEPEIEELEFSSDVPSTSLKIGYLVAEALGAECHLSKKTLHFVHGGVTVEFNSGKKDDKIIRVMEKEGVGSSSYLMHDLYNKDFTINMVSYDPISKRVTKLFDDKEIRSVFDADDLISFNPFIALRAIYLSVRYGMPISEDVESAIMKYAPLINHNSSDEKYQFAFRKILSENKEEAIECFKKYEIQFSEGE